MKKKPMPNSSPEPKGIKITGEIRRLYAQRDPSLDNDPDCAPLPPEKWAAAMRPDEYEAFRKTYRARKKLTAVRIDADILDWLRSQGEGHLTRINQILRDRMIAESRK